MTDQKSPVRHPAPSADAEAAPPISTAQTSRWKRFVFSLVAVICGLLLLEGLSSVAWLVVDLNRLDESAEPVVALREDFHCQYDPELGWAHIPGKQISDFYGPGRDMTINSSGVRGTQSIAIPKPVDTFRLVCLGDSFTLGYGVDDEKTYPHLLGERHASVETVNLGQGGYSVGQCYLWYRRLVDELDADAVVMSIIVADLRRIGISRTVNGYATPQFSLDNNGDVVVSNIPVPPKLEVGEQLVEYGQRWEFVTDHSGLVRTFSQLTVGLLPEQTGELEHMATGVEIVRAVAQLCAEHDQQFALVLLPTLQELESPGLAGIYHATSDILSETAGQMQVPYCDLWPHFESTTDRQALFLEEEFHHYSRRGNGLVARELNSWLPTVLKGYPKPT